MTSKEIQRDARDRRHAPALADVPTDAAMKRKEERRQLRVHQDRMQQLRLQLGGKLGRVSGLGPPVTIVFEGWDAAGKGGAIRRLVDRLDARHVRVVQFAAPTADELRHHWLSRFWRDLPGWGGMAIYDRSWYGRVLVERVEGIAEEEAWRRAYKEIREFERSLWSEGMIFVKLWLQISDQEQLRRFTMRGDDPLRSYKLTEEDWRNRQKRPKYEAAVEDMFAETSIPESPWIVVPAENKRYARVEVLAQTIRRIEEGMRLRGIEPLPPIDE
jgi:AMP-polyphosphate phosphotransferase